MSGEKPKEEKDRTKGRKEGRKEGRCSPVSPDIHGVVLPEALVIEAVDLGDLPALVVAPDQRDAVRVPDLEGQEQQKGLNTVKAAVDKVTHEEVVGGRALPANIEQLNEVVELAMNISTNLKYIF